MVPLLSAGSSLPPAYMVHTICCAWQFGYLTNPTACTGAESGPGHVVWEAGIVLSQYLVKHAGRMSLILYCCCAVASQITSM